MLPVSQQSAQCRHQRQWLVEHDVMLCLRYFDHRRRATEQVEHVLADLWREQDGVFAAEHRNAAACRFQPLRSVADGKALPDGGIEFPGEAAIDFLQRVPRYPIDYVEILTGLWRHQPEASHRHRE